MNFQVNKNIFFNSGISFKLCLLSLTNEFEQADDPSRIIVVSMFILVLTQPANSTLERKRRCDIASMLVINTQTLSVIVGSHDQLGTRKKKTLGLRIQQFSTRGLKTANTLFLTE